MTYDEDAIYVGARLWESDSSQRVTSDMRRDASNLYNNDHFGVMLDTFYDRRNGYIFFANAQGGMATPKSSTKTRAPTGTRSGTRGRQTSTAGGRWRSDSFPVDPVPGGRADLGHQLPAHVRWKNEASYLSADSGSTATACTRRAPATLVGIVTPAHGCEISTSRPTRWVDGDEPRGAPAIVQRGDAESASDIKWGSHASYVADFTYNTDFAQVEDDQQQVNLTRFSCSFRRSASSSWRAGSLRVRRRAAERRHQDNDRGNLPAPCSTAGQHRARNGSVVPIIDGGRLLGRSGHTASACSRCGPTTSQSASRRDRLRGPPGTARDPAAQPYRRHRHARAAQCRAAPDHELRVRR